MVVVHRIVILFLICFPALAAEGRFSIGGVVVDPSGVGVSNARITLESSSLGAPQSASTDANGVFRFSALPPGAFQVRVNAEGFAEHRVLVNITSRVPADLKIPLKLANMRQEIT